MTPDEEELIRKRQRERARADWPCCSALFVVLMFAITIAKMTINR